MRMLFVKYCRCQNSGAFSDENPALWSLIHFLTFNLPERVTSAQYEVLRALPLWLREHLSCSMCRSHVQDHLISSGIPTSKDGTVWAWYYWRAHNIVSEASEVTRCGSMDCDYGADQTSPNPKWQCPGLYKHSWFMDFGDAKRLWTLNATLQSRFRAKRRPPIAGLHYLE